MKFWASRDMRICSSVEIWTTEPWLSKKDHFIGESMVFMEWSPAAFEFFTGQAIAPGECKEVTMRCSIS